MSGRPYPPELRGRVMSLLGQGLGPTEVASRLCVSRMTVWRYRRAAEAQGVPVPVPRASGGFRRSNVKLRRADVARLVRMALEHPKWTVAELRAGPWSVGRPAVSDSTVLRALKKAGITQKRAVYVDPRVTSDAAIQAERQRFRTAQRDDNALAPERLIFFDESLFHLNMQARRGWGKAGGPAFLLRPKGRTPTTSVFLTLGSHGLLHYSIKPPSRVGDPLPSRYEASELKQPGRRVDIGMTTKEVKGLTCRELKQVLRDHSVRLSDENGQALNRESLVRTVLHLRRQGRLGLLRAQRGRRHLGGPLQPLRSSTADVVRYWRDEFAPWFRHGRRQPGDTRSLEDLTVCWDNASTHSPVRSGDTTRISVFHRWMREWGFGGVIFLPPRSPSMNPVELCWAYLKSYVRKHAPDEGYTQDGLERAIHEAVARVKPDFIESWIRACGYVAESRPVLLARQPAVPSIVPLRWAGYGRREAVEARETAPEVGFLGDGVYEPERIVDERLLDGGRREYRIRWRGYKAGEDTWEPRSHLLLGAGVLLADWDRRRKK